MALAHATKGWHRHAGVGRTAFVVFLALHGVAHLAGVGPTLDAVANDEPVELLAGVWVASNPLLLRALAGAWAVLGTAFVGTAVLVWRRARGARGALAVTTTASLALALLFVPAATVGVAVDVVLLVVAAPRFGIVVGHPRPR